LDLLRYSLKRWKWAAPLSGVIGLGLIVLGFCFAWYYGSRVRVPDDTQLYFFDKYVNYLIGWGYVLILVVSGWHLVVEAKVCLWPVKGDRS
jgi:hypothetical protein